MFGLEAGGRFTFPPKFLGISQHNFQGINSNVFLVWPVCLPMIRIRGQFCAASGNMLRPVLLTNWPPEPNPENN